MGLFDAFKKKNCDICGEEIKFLGNRKLEDGNMCKSCAGKLSQWFDDRRSSTIEQIKEQLKYREENLEQVKAFNATLTLGDYHKVYIDEDNGKFMVVTSDDIVDENPDILAFTDILGCVLDIDEDENEILREGKDGEMVSYNPPRYEYDYDFYIKLTVRHPYFSDIKFKLNNRRIHIEDRSYATPAVNRYSNTGAAVLGQVIGALAGANKGYNPMNDPSFARYKEMGDNIVSALMQVRQQGRDQAAAAAAPKAPVTCPYCGAVTTPTDDGCCEFCGAKL